VPKVGEFDIDVAQALKLFMRSVLSSLSVDC
jgi:hypothetical protein